MLFLKYKGLIVSTVSLPDLCKDPFSFETILSLYQTILATKIAKLDMANITFIEPYSLLCLLLMGRSYLRLTGERLMLHRVPPHIMQYATRMDFFKYNIFTVDESLHKDTGLKRSASSSRLLEIIEIPGKEKESVKVIAKVIATFRKRAIVILKNWFTLTTIDHLVTVISEICQNIFEHSLDSGFVVIQSYTYMNERIFRIAIVDSGVGVPGSFEHSHMVLSLSNAKLLEAVLTTPLSSKRRYGYGLCQVNAIMEQLKGSIFLRSENAYISVLHHKRAAKGSYIFLKDDCPTFPGTQFSITLVG
ncbi:MAG TPA: ATP-binding protein [Spirochaetota bacterium]|nr:ATP-binding protein [Spirochaetota bacterium]